MFMFHLSLKPVGAVLLNLHEYAIRYDLDPQLQGHIVV